MEDLPTSLITQQLQARPRTGEELETFGKYAASLYDQGACKTLTRAVVETVKTAGLAPEQVRRVVEFANTSAYLTKFASSGGSHKVITFAGGPASYPDVLRDLNDGGGGSLPDPVAPDYHLPPPDVAKLASRNADRIGLEDSLLKQAFAAEDPALPYADPLRPIYDMRTKLAGLADEVTSEMSGLETHYMDACDELFRQVKQASLSGASLGQVITVMQLGNENPEFFKAAFDMLTPRLLRNGVFSNEVDIASSLEKFANAGMPNPEHPLVGAFSDYCETLTKLAALRALREEIGVGLDQAATFFQKAAGVASSIREVAGTIPKAWGVARDTAAKASVPVSNFTSELAGETAGDLMGAAVKYAPHAAVALGAEEAYQEARANPAVHGASNFVLSRVPYTNPYMLRQYQLRGGMM